MTAPGKGETVSARQVSGNSAAPSVPVKDVIPVTLVIGIFAAVMALTFFVLKDNWYTDMTRYQSLKAQQNREWQTAIDKLEKLRAAGSREKNVYQEFSPTYLSELGFSYLGLGKLDKSLEFYKLAQEHRGDVPADETGNPRPPVDFNNMIGYVYFKMGKLDDAEKALQEALKFNKLDPLSNFTLGEIAMKRGGYTQAADYFKVVANNPDYEQQVKKYYAEIEQKLFAGIK